MFFCPCYFILSRQGSSLKLDEVFLFRRLSIVFYGPSASSLIVILLYQETATWVVQGLISVLGFVDNLMCTIIMDCLISDLSLDSVYHLHLLNII